MFIHISTISVCEVQKYYHKMLRYVLCLLLINACYHSSGLPTHKNVANSLMALANKCENQFLSHQIKSKIKDCSLPVPPYENKQFQCLIFYDINVQLCSAVAAAKLALSDNYTVKINEEQDVNTLCESAKQWVFSNLTEYPNYSIGVETVLKNSATCGMVCGAEELLREQANYYCKYYKWGREMLNFQVNTTQKLNASIPVQPVSDLSIDKKTGASAAINTDPLDIAIKNASEKTKEIESSLAITPEKVSDPKNEAIKPPITIESTPENKQVSSAIDMNPEEAETVPEDKGVLSAPAKVAADTNQEVEKEIERPDTAKDLPKTVNDGQVPDKGAEHDKAVIKNPKQNSDDSEDYPGNDIDFEEGKEHLIGMQGDDGGEEHILSEDTKQDQLQNKDLKIESMGSSFSRDMSQKEFYPSTIQDGFTEDDDHFFTFFLTAVILVILLYILYHNKNKVSKLFFGIMVEGRQSGRRRNSRGHSYRRLDTLEQAMNTNTAAPPSKIIY